MKISTNELANIIYDTLFQNTNNKQFSELAPEIDYQEIDNNINMITFGIDNKKYKIIIKN